MYFSSKFPINRYIWFINNYISINIIQKNACMWNGGWLYVRLTQIFHCLTQASFSHYWKEYKILSLEFFFLHSKSIIAISVVCIYFCFYNSGVTSIVAGEWPIQRMLSLMWEVLEGIQCWECRGRGQGTGLYGNRDQIQGLLIFLSSSPIAIILNYCIIIRSLIYTTLVKLSYKKECTNFYFYR